MQRNGLTPQEAVELFIGDKRSDDPSARTTDNFSAHLRYVTEWLRDTDVDAETVRDIDGLTLKRYKQRNTQLAAMEALAERRRASSGEIAGYTGLAKHHTRMCLRTLDAEGITERIGSGSATEYVHRSALGS